MKATLCALLLLVAAAVTAQESDWQGVERVVAIADVHGDYDNYIAVLQQAGVVNRRGRWDAGATHFVQLGDVPDRGPDTAKIIRHLMALEKQAKKAGGRVHALIGNHEVMNITGDLRYVHPGEYAALKSRNAKSLQNRYYQQVVDYLSAQEDAPVIDDAFEERWRAEHPRGYVEHRQIWHPDGEFGAWVASHNAVIRINRSLFVHGGLSSKYIKQSLTDINQRVRDELASLDASQERLIEDEDGPLWYRGLAMGAQTPEIAEHLTALQERFAVDRIVVGHTPGYGTVVPRYDARVLAADSGIAKEYGGHLAAVLIEAGKAYTVQRGKRVPLPSSDKDLLAYFKAINELEPGVNNLMFLIKQLETVDPEE